MEILDLYSCLHLASFVIMLFKQFNHSTFSTCFFFIYHNLHMGWLPGDFHHFGFFHIHFHSIVSSKKYRLSSNRPRSTITDIEARDTSVQFTNAQPITPRSTTFPLTSSVSQVPSVITPSASEMRSHCVTLPPI